MPFNPAAHRRRSVRLKGWDYASRGGFPPYSGAQAATWSQCLTSTTARLRRASATGSSIHASPHWEQTSAGTPRTTTTPNSKSTAKVVAPGSFPPPQSSVGARHASPLQNESASRRLVRRGVLQYAPTRVTGVSPTPPCPRTPRPRGRRRPWPSPRPGP